MGVPAVDVVGMLVDRVIALTALVGPDGLRQQLVGEIAQKLPAQVALKVAELRGIMVPDGPGR